MTHCARRDLFYIYFFLLILPLFLSFFFSKPETLATTPCVDVLAPHSLDALVVVSIMMSLHGAGSLLAVASHLWPQQHHRFPLETSCGVRSFDLLSTRDVIHTLEKEGKRGKTIAFLLPLSRLFLKRINEAR